MVLFTSTQILSMTWFSKQMSRYRTAFPAPKRRSNPLPLISLPNTCPNDGSIENTKVVKGYKAFFRENNKLYYVNCKISLEIYFLVSRKVKIQKTLFAPTKHTYLNRLSDTFLSFLQQSNMKRLLYRLFCMDSWVSGVWLFSVAYLWKFMKDLISRKGHDSWFWTLREGSNYTSAA